MQKATRNHTYSARKMEKLPVKLFPIKNPFILTVFAPMKTVILVGHFLSFLLRVLPKMRIEFLENVPKKPTFKVVKCIRPGYPLHL